MKRIAFASLIVAGLASAQVVKDRKVIQQGRIAQGVKSGQLTASETKNLESQEGALNRQTRQDRAQNGGKLTRQQKVQIFRQQNKLSTQIYADKHNAQHQ
jgi:hypothetical protein